MIPVGAILPAQHIRRLCELPNRMIYPFSERTEFGGTSYGLGPAGYDLRIDRDIELWPGSSIRADAMEYIRLPNHVMGLLFTKSTWARVHVEHSGTTIDPGFEGVLRLEINYHHGPGTQRIVAGTGIVHVVFCYLAESTEMPYRGKYYRQGRDQDAIF